MINEIETRLAYEKSLLILKFIEECPSIYQKYEDALEDVVQQISEFHNLLIRDEAGYLKFGHFVDKRYCINTIENYYQEFLQDGMKPL